MPNNTTTTAPAIVLSADDATATALKSTVRAAIAGDGKYLAYVEAHNVTRETIKAHADALAAFIYPNDEPVQTVSGKRTRYGNAVQKVKAGLTYALADETDTPVKPVTLRAVLSGEGGGSVTVPADHPLYKSIVALITGDK